MIKDFESLLKIESSKINEMIEDWLMHLTKQVSPNSIPTMYYGIELFFSMNDVLINFKKLRRMLPSRVKKSGARPWKTEDIRAMLEATRYKRDKALIHFMASTGARIGCLEGLKMSHIINMPEKCKAVFIYEDDEQEYWTFLTPEASSALEKYLEERTSDGERLNPKSPVFRTLYSPKNIHLPKPMAIMSARSVIYRCMKTARIRREKQGFAYDIQANHGFRKRFNTILKLENELNSNIAEKLMGHKRGLDGVYFQPTREQCFEEFKKAIPELSINETIRLEQELEKKKEQLDKHQSNKDARILELEDRLSNTERLLLELMKRVN
jgi:integrase